MGAAKSRAALTWDDKAYPLCEVFEKYGFPNFVCLKEGYYGTSDSTSFEAGQVLMLHELCQKQSFVGEDSLSRPIAIPVECVNNVLVCPSSKSFNRDAIFVGVISKLYPQIEYFRVLENDCVEDKVKRCYKLHSIVKVEDIDFVNSLVKFKDVRLPLPFSSRIIFEPLVDCRKYTLKDAVEAFDLPIKVRFLSSGNDDKKLENNLENAVSNLGKVTIHRLSRPEMLVVATKLDADQSLTLPNPSEKCSLIPKYCKLKVSVAKELLQNDPTYLKMVRNFNDAFLKKYDLEVLIGNKSSFRTILSEQPHDRRFKKQSPGEKHEEAKTPIKNDHVCETIDADEPKDGNDSKIADSHVTFKDRLSMTSQSSHHEDETDQNYLVMTGQNYVDMTSSVYKRTSQQDDEDKINEHLNVPVVSLFSASPANSEHDVNWNENTASESEIQTFPGEKHEDEAPIKNDHVCETIDANEPKDGHDSKLTDSHVEFKDRFSLNSQSSHHEDETDQNYLDMTGQNYVDMTSLAFERTSQQDDEKNKINEHLNVPEVSLSSASPANSKHDVNWNENTASESEIQTFPGEKHEDEAPIKNNHVCETIDEPKDGHDSKLADSHVEFKDRFSLNSQSSHHGDETSQDNTDQIYLDLTEQTDVDMYKEYNDTDEKHEDEVPIKNDHFYETIDEPKDGHDSKLADSHVVVEDRFSLTSQSSHHEDETDQNYFDMTGQNYVDMTSLAYEQTSQQDDEENKINEHLNVLEVSLSSASPANSKHVVNSNVNTAWESGIQTFPGKKHENEAPIKNDHIYEIIDEPKDGHDSKLADSHVVVEDRFSLNSQSSHHEDETDQNYVDMTSLAYEQTSQHDDEENKINEHLNVPEVSLSSASPANSEHDVNWNENTASESEIQTFREAGKLGSEDQNKSETPCLNSPTLAQLPADISCLSLAGVGRLLTSLNMQFYVDKFKEEQIDGAVLVTLDEEMLFSLDLTRFHVTKLTKFIKGWRPNVS
ncbi:uncharacterized protein LOC114535078 [Dendronephthya gigantea]|uniref:uncharacterized protein LOC114535078 n=1 Tax=Dendronephthya gigantea TaxID=151771 RepID=UPI00106D2CD5|nr:uncharacterized protein LOC114535078 [Dendronephthya gigantea]